MSSNTFNQISSPLMFGEAFSPVVEDPLAALPGIQQSQLTVVKNKAPALLVKSAPIAGWKAGRLAEVTALKYQLSWALSKIPQPPRPVSSAPPVVVAGPSIFVSGPGPSPSPITNPTPVVTTRSNNTVQDKYLILDSELTRQGFMRNGGWTGKFGITSYAVFLRLTAAQEIIMDNWLEHTYNSIIDLRVPINQATSVNALGLVSVALRSTPANAVKWAKTGIPITGDEYEIFSQARYAIDVLLPILEG